MSAGPCAWPPALTVSLSGIVPTDASDERRHAGVERLRPGAGEASGAASVTVTSNVADAPLPVASVAVQVTVVVPRSNAEPLGGVQPTVGAGSTSSVAVGSVQVTTALAPVVVVAMSAGMPWSSGAVVSTGGVRDDHVEVDRRRDQVARRLAVREAEEHRVGVARAGGHRGGHVERAPA